MDFMWAVEQMKQGKKVRIKSWQSGFHIYLKHNVIFNKHHETYDCMFIEFESKDWEVVEKQKETLYEKRNKECYKCADECFSQLNVRQALKEFLNRNDSEVSIIKALESTFGKELVE